ncbi:hypothetical protein K0C01_12500 [Salinarchaeum sp. IM2453]|uniref:DUF5796 family protein n=1 Tax=Salinarchaeum sp. IM2453 TaxID=2862870 RepID=UPI001C83FEFB|nr:DUF5796 family protein [Salinarchaeum sp. IM2453]QZA88581.1 hypothetical protein K0C01_12500 [Salinarchaeum sp. IM2453]
MDYRDSVAPETLSVEVTDEQVTIEYLDGRVVSYDGQREPTAPPIRTQPRQLVQVLVTNSDNTQGVLTYVNELNTESEILEDSGVGRVFVEPDETTEVYPNVTATADGYAVVVDADLEAIDGRVFVFEEGQRYNQYYELIPSAESE